jgi:hypothetical protein
MKSITTIIILLGALFAACNDDANSSKTNKNAVVVASDTSTERYQCPMNCESDTAYTTAGKCPVCEMDLEKLQLN